MDAGGEGNIGKRGYRELVDDLAYTRRREHAGREGWEGGGVTGKVAGEREPEEINFNSLNPPNISNGEKTINEINEKGRGLINNAEEKLKPVGVNQGHRGDKVVLINKVRVAKEIIEGRGINNIMGSNTVGVKNTMMDFLIRGNGNITPGGTMM